MVKGWYKAFMLTGAAVLIVPSAFAAIDFPTGEPAKSLSSRFVQWKDSQNQTLADKLQQENQQTPDAKKPMPWVDFATAQAQAQDKKAAPAITNPIMLPPQPASAQATTSETSIPSVSTGAAVTSPAVTTTSNIPAETAAVASTNPTIVAPVVVDPKLLREKAFEDVVEQAIPLTPSQIRQLRTKYDESLQAATLTYDLPPQPVSSLQYVDLSPGATPPAIRLAKGFVSSIVFVDATGAPWPIVAYDLGDPKAFSLEWDKHNVLMVQALTAYNYGNIAVKLQGEPTPIMLTLIPGQKQVDYRVDLHVQKVGPNAKESITIDNLPNTEKPVLLNVLNSLPPAGSKPVHASGSGVQAWNKNGVLYIRTQWTILSPGWLSVIESNDGMKAYEMQSTPTILVSQYGKPVQINLKES